MSNAYRMIPKDFASYFAEFYARTYREEVLEFTKQTFTSHMNKVIKHQAWKIFAIARDFLLNLTDNLCKIFGTKQIYNRQSKNPQSNLREKTRPNANLDDLRFFLESGSSKGGQYVLSEATYYTKRKLQKDVINHW